MLIDFSYATATVACAKLPSTRLLVRVNVLMLIVAVGCASVAAPFGEMESCRLETPLVVVGLVSLCATVGAGVVVVVVVVELGLDAEVLDPETALCACGTGTAVETVAAPAADVALGLGFAIAAVDKVAELMGDTTVERVDAAGIAATFGICPNDPGAQRHWQSHAPPTATVPVPCATAPGDPTESVPTGLVLAIAAVVKVPAPPVPVPAAPAGGFTPGAADTLDAPGAAFPLTVTVTS
jgi:hypothetical protein